MFKRKFLNGMQTLRPDFAVGRIAERSIGQLAGVLMKQRKKKKGSW
jgi:hypothetical protein